MASSPITAWQIEGGRWKQRQTSSSWAPKSLWMVTGAMKSEDNCFWKESNDKPRQCVEKQGHYSADKGLYSQGYGLPNGHVRL